MIILSIFAVIYTQWLTQGDEVQGGGRPQRHCAI